MIPLGLADLTSATVVVGARLVERHEGRVVLADALRTLELEDEGGASPDDCQPGDFVRATISQADGSGEAVCWSLERIGRGSPAVPRSATPLLLRQAALSALRGYFEGERFLEVHTPSFGVCPGLDPHVQALGTAVGLRGTEHSMTSPEFFMKRLLSEGVPRCFQMTSVFRAEELGAWHEPEFTLLEWYRAYEGLDAVMTDTERLVRDVALTLAEAGGPGQGRPALELTLPFPRLTVREAFRQFAGIEDSSDYAATSPVAYFQTFVDQVEPRLAELPHPVFLTEFPASQSALARLSPTDRSVALRFELVAHGVELCNGYDELTDALEQRARFQRELTRRQAAGEPLYPLDERFLGALEQGMPPAAGNALGVERLLAVLTGSPRIDAFYAFPAAAH